MDPTFVEQVAGARRVRSGVFGDDAITLSWGEEGVTRIYLRALAPDEARGVHIPATAFERVLIASHDIEDTWWDRARERDVHRVACTLVGAGGQRLELAADVLAPLVIDLPRASWSDAQLVPFETLRDCVMTAVVHGAAIELVEGGHSPAEATHPYRASAASPRAAREPSREKPILAELQRLLAKASFDKVVAQLARRDEGLLRFGWCNLEDEGLRVLTPLLLEHAELSELQLAANRLTPASVPNIVSLLGSSALRRLDLSSNRFGDPGMQEILEALDCSRLQSLNVASCDLSDETASMICQKLTPPLGYLDLSSNPLTETSARLIGGCSSMAGLTNLRLRGTRIDDEGLRHLAGSPHLERVRDMDLGNTGIGDVSAIEELASDASPFRDLRRLALYGNTVGADGARALSGAPFLVRLDSLSLGRNDIGDEGLLALLSAGLRPTQLDVSENALTLRSVEALFAEPTRLSSLTLSSNPLGDETAFAIASNPNASGLRRLEVRSCDFSPAAIDALEASDHLQGLDKLDT